jgi:hypothetical protein
MEDDGSPKSGDISDGNKWTFQYISSFLVLVLQRPHLETFGGDDSGEPRYHTK